MWTCPRCGEPHEDQFKICWKCTSDELAGHPTGVVDKEKTPTLRIPAADAAPVERRLRSLRSIFVRALTGFVVGMLLGVVSAHRLARLVLPDAPADSLSDTIAFGLVLGLFVGGVVGVFFWVAFPYEPMNESRAAARRDEQDRNPPD